MRIIGGKDYYDGGGAGFDTDETRVFVRQNHAKAEPSEIARLPNLYKTIFDVTKPGKKPWNAVKVPISPLYVIFCGTLYRGAFHHRTTWDSNNHHTHYDTAWTVDAFRELVRAHDGTINEKRYRFIYNEYIGEKQLEEYFTPKVLTGTDLEVLIENNIAISVGFYDWLSYHKKIDWYDQTDVLKTIGFASVLDTWQAYQQLDQFVGSQLAKEEDNMVRLSDEELIAKHGFDELNFRNQVHAGKPRGRT